MFDWVKEFFEAVSECWLLGNTCVPNWQAWSGWAGWLGAFGGWAGALATFLAVLLPYRRERRRAHFRAKITLASFVEGLDQLRKQLDGISSIRLTLEHGDYRAPKRELEAMLTVAISFPVVDPEPELEQVLVEIGLLKKEVDTWKQATHVYAFGQTDPVEPRQLANLRPMLDALTDRLHGSIERTEAAIFAAVPGLERNALRN